MYFRSNRRVLSIAWIGAFVVVLGLWNRVVNADFSPVVDLSNQGLKKEDFFVRMQPKLNLHNVTELILRGNEFDSFLDCSTKLDNLRILDLSQNHLKRFYFVCKEYNLQVLNVSHNHLEYIDDYALNERIPKLKILDLSWNRLTVINETMVDQMKLLEYFSIANNPVEDFHEKSLWNLKSLRHLDLSNISVSDFAPGLFKPLTNLTFLNLSRNPIETIAPLPLSLQELDISMTHIYYPDNLIFPKLVALHMNYMPNLTHLVVNDFENLTMLESLSAEGCRRLREFRVWPPNSQLLPKLRRLSIRGCAVESLNGDLRPIMQRTAVVDLRNNPWNCDCRMQWVNRLDLTNELSREIRCRSPPPLEGKLLISVPNVELVCVDESGAAAGVYPLIWVGVALLAVAPVAITVFFLSKKPFSEWIKLPMRGRNTVSYKNVVESNADLVRILPPGEPADRPED